MQLHLIENTFTFNGKGSNFLTKLFYSRAKAAFFVYSIDDERSLEEIESLIKEHETSSYNPKIVKILVGNKRDLELL